MDNRKGDNIPFDSLETWPNGGLKQLLLWKNWRKTALVFSLILMLLLDIASNSIISVVSVAGVLVLLTSISYWCFVWGMRKLRKSNKVEHPYQSYLEIDFNISEDAAVQLARLFVFKVNPILKRLSSFFLVEDLFDSIKFLMFLCGLNVVGDYTNGITLIVVGFILIFTLPKFYEWKKPFIDMQLQHLQRLKNHFLCSKKKTLPSPTATVDPQIISSKQLQKTSANDIDVDQQFVSSDFGNDYNWQQHDITMQDYQHIKAQ
ncbi:hypothetical protein KR222_008798 [Zaprionus bogoriensis]|nr:hypothetical protein KR222_008798 [Zaprionus bogoriensis]